MGHGSRTDAEPGDGNLERACETLAVLCQQIVLPYNNAYELYWSRVVTPEPQAIESTRVLYTGAGTWQQIECKLEGGLRPWGLGTGHVRVGVMSRRHPGFEGVGLEFMALGYKC
jgi:hypothetical protein